MKEIDKSANQYGNQSANGEPQAFLTSSAKRARDERDMAIINRLADKLNAEAEDVLQYQVEL